MTIQEAANLFGFGTDNKPQPEKQSAAPGMESEEYKTPDQRSCGRPHNLGWLNLLGDEELYGENSSEEEAGDAFESDNWREVIRKRQGTQ